MVSFSTALASGSMAKLTILNLSRNKIGDRGMHAFSTALASGAMLHLKELDLDVNQIGDEGLKSFTSALASGAVPQLEELWICSPSDELTAHCSSKGIELNVDPL
eukprot:1065402-Prymnesium_polylepis.1